MIWVDTHGSSNFQRLGYISTKDPEKTEFALREKLPKYWIPINGLRLSKNLWSKHLYSYIPPL